MEKKTDYTEDKRKEMQAQLSTIVDRAISELSDLTGNPFYAKSYLDSAVKVAKTLEPDQIITGKDLIEREVLNDNEVKAIIIAYKSQTKNKAVVIAALGELDNLVDTISTNLCDPPFSTEEWSQFQTIREAVQDAKEHFEGLK